ncbi:5' nucleotidase [Vibrio phage 1.170.O._10N.261.52.C3]|nr:5' nucleotidase [Vibrio phage 1.170.O._10N.261.52.C3]
MSKTIAIDVDLTVCDVTDKWLTWLCERHLFLRAKEYITDLEKEDVHYNLGYYFDIPLKEALDFWKQVDLYDDVECRKDALVTVEKLYKDFGYKIVFISYCADCGSHAGSKAKMLQRQFSFIKPEHFHFCQTKSKGVLREAFDVFVDDRNSFLNQMKGDVLCLRPHTIYRQDEDLKYEASINTHEFMDWGEVYDHLCLTDI